MAERRLAKVLDVTLSDSPWIAYRGIRRIPVANDDIDIDPPCTVRSLGAGKIVFTDSLGEKNETGALAAGDDVVGPGDQLVLISIIHGDSTVDSVELGRG